MNAPSRPPLILTDDQFEDMGRRGAFEKVGRVELRGGMIAPMNPVYYPHANVVFELGIALREAVRKAGLALQVHVEISARFGGGFLPTVDVVVWDQASAPADLDGPVPGAAVRLAVEVADSSLGDDLGAKLIDYAQTGLAEYWVADVKSRTIFQHRDPGATGYGTRVAIRFGDVAAALTLPLAVDTSKL